MVSLDYVLYGLRWGGNKTTRLAAITAAGLVIVITALVLINYSLRFSDGKGGQNKSGFAHADPAPLMASALPVKASVKSGANLASLEQQVHNDRDNIPARLALINGLIDHYKPTSARAMMRAMAPRITLVPDRIKLARLHMRLGDNEQAMRVLKDIESGATADHSFEIAMLGGEVRLRLRDYQAAIRLAEIIGPYPEADFLKARVYYAMGAGQKTRALMVGLDDRAVAGRGLGSRVALFRARIALDNNDFAGAFAHTEAAAVAGASRLQQRLVDIEIAIRAGRFADAENWLDGFDERAREHSMIKEIRAHYHGARGEFREAARLLDEIVHWSGGSLRRPLLHALIKRAAGDPRQARLMVREHLRRAPDDWVGLYLDTEFMLEEEAYDLAAPILERLDRAAPSPRIGAFAHYQLALAKGVPDRAIAMLDRAIRAPGNGGANPATVLLGPSRMQIAVPPQRRAFQRQKTLRAYILANQPQKALAAIVTGQRTDHPQSAPAPLDLLIHGEVLMANFRNQEARAVLAMLPPSYRNTARAAVLALQLERQQGDEGRAKDAAIAKAQHHLASLEGGGAVVVMDALRVNDFVRAQRQALADKGRGLGNQREVLKALARAILARPLVSDSDRQFASFIAARALNNRDDSAMMVIAARLHDHSGNHHRAGQIYREVVIANPDTWQVMAPFLDHLAATDSRHEGHIFLTALAAGLPPGRPARAVMAGVALLSDDDPAQMVAALKMQYARNPSVPVAAAYGRALMAAGDYQTAGTLLRTALSGAEQSVEDIVLMARSLARLDDVEGAISILDIAIDEQRNTDIAALKPLVMARAALVPMRAPPRALIEKQADIRMSRWAILLVAPGYGDQASLSAYAIALERAGYGDKAALIRREITPIAKAAVRASQNETGPGNFLAFPPFVADYENQVEG